MLTFVVPVKSKRVTSDWLRFCKLFERTLISICNQTDTNFKVIAVCHEIPEIDFTHKNLHFIQADFEPPLPRATESKESLNKHREIDKGDKIKLGVAYAQVNFNTDYVMTVDSDDFISNQGDFKRWEKIHKVDDGKIWTLRNTLRTKRKESCSDNYRIEVYQMLSTNLYRIGELSKSGGL